MKARSPKPRRPRPGPRKVSRAAPSKPPPEVEAEETARRKGKPRRFARRARRLAQTTFRHASGWIRRHPWRSAGGVAAVILTAFSYLFLATPSWYRPPMIAPEQRQQVRNNLVAAEQAFTESLRAGKGAFVYHVHQDDLNRWIAMRREIYPLLDQLTPPEIGDPFVLFTEGRIRVAGHYRDGLFGSVLSLDVTAKIEGKDLILRATSAHVGRFRIPLGLLAGSGLTQPIEEDEEDAWPGSPPIWGDLVSGLHLGGQARWKNGGIVYRVVEVQVHRGRLDLTVEPLGHQESREHRRH